MPTKFIQVNEVPRGSTPLRFREQWVGIRLPVATKNEVRKNPPSNSTTVRIQDGDFSVLQERAVSALRKAGKVEAAEFYTRTKLPDSYLVFNREACEVVLS